MNLPNEYVNVKITYETIVSSGLYGEIKKKEIVTRRAFYTKSSGFYDSHDNWVNTPDGYFCVPQCWQNFTFSNGETALLPHTFYQYPRVYPENVIKWSLDE